MNLDSDALRTACYELARATRMGATPVDEVFAKGMVEGYFSEAKRHERYFVDMERDPNFIVHAVRYLASAHAIPPLSGNMSWFATALEVLIELACPNTGLSVAQEPFFREIERGIEDSRTGYEP